MADIELVIKIPEELFSEIDDENYQSKISWYDTTLYCAIKDGKTLPKGHGRLIDSDMVCNELEGKSFDTSSNYNYAIDAVEDTPTIIEADKEVENNG